MRHILIFSLFLILLSNVAFGQGTTIIRFDDDTTNLVLKTDKNGNKKLVSKKKSFPKNNIKIGLFSAAYGKVPVYYERYLTDFLTVQASVGFAFRDFIGDFYRGMSFGRNNYIVNTNWDNVNYFDNYDSYTSYIYKKSGFGFSVSAAPRFFVTSDAMDGFYISPEVEYAIRTVKAQMLDADGNYSSDIMKEKLRNLYFHMNFGWERDFEPVTLDFSFSVGFSKSKDKRLDTGYDTYNKYINKEISISKMYPYMRLNLDIGGLFGK